MNFLKICFGISTVLASAALFVFSLNNAFAENKSNDTMYFPQESGKIMIAPFMTPIFENGVQKRTDTNFMVWDTETGASRSYYVGKNAIGEWEALVSRVQLPANPLD